MRRAPEWIDAARWAANQIEGSLNDAQEVIGELLDSSALVQTELENGQHTTIVVASGELPQPLRNRLLEALEESSRVIVLGGPLFDDASWRVSDVIDCVADHARPLEFTHEVEWWGLTLADSNGHQSSWNEVVTTLEREIGEHRSELSDTRTEAQHLQRSRNEAVDELKAVSEELGTALAENSLLLASLEDFEATQEELARARTELTDLSLRLQGLEEEIQVAHRTRRAADQRIRELQRKVTKLVRDRDDLKHRLALEKWKLRSLKNRRWWRLGTLIASALRRPLQVKSHIQIFKQVLNPPPMPDRPIRRRRSRRTEVDDPKGRAGTPVRTHADNAIVAVDFEPAPPPRQLADLRVAAILDDMSRACFAPDCDLVTFTPKDWRETLSEKPPHLLFVESAWKGNHGSWEYKVGSYSYADSIGLPDLTALIDWCRARGIPTVFWNKEDPVHFEKFKEAAQLFDLVFTTDSDRAPAYRQLPGLESRIVAPLPFAAQPLLHHPGPFAGRDPRPVFAGTFYRNRHPERIGQMEVLLDAAKEHDLVIYDRMGGAVTDSFGYPDRFRDNIVGSVPYPEMVQVYRRHRVFLNVNSVVESPTMMSRRVFELLACGTPVVSTPAKGIAEIFGDAVTTVSSPEEASEAIGQLVHDDSHWMAVSRKGVLAVAARHLYRDRLLQVASGAGIELSTDGQVASQSDGAETELLSNGTRWKRFANAESPNELDELAVVARLVDCAAVAFTSRDDEVYTYGDRLPDSDFIVNETAIEKGFEPTPGSDAGDFGRVFLFPR